MSDNTQLQLSDQDVQIILNALTQRPYAEVAGTIARIAQQVNASAPKEKSVGPVGGEEVDL